MPKSLEQKKTEAAARQEAYNALTPAQKLERLDKAFGAGKGAARERARIAKKMAKPSGETAPATADPVTSKPEKSEKKGKGKKS